eukprot:3931397-Rhodomonas_salina.1
MRSKLTGKGTCEALLCGFEEQLPDLYRTSHSKRVGRYIAIRYISTGHLTARVGRYRFPLWQYRASHNARVGRYIAIALSVPDIA